jgi:hypothetical protein
MHAARMHAVRMHAVRMHVFECMRFECMCSGACGSNASGANASGSRIGRERIGRECIGCECIGCERIGCECIGCECIGRECIGFVHRVRGHGRLTIHHILGAAQPQVACRRSYRVVKRPIRTAFAAPRVDAVRRRRRCEVTPLTGRRRSDSPTKDPSRRYLDSSARTRGACDRAEPGPRAVQ